MSSEANIKAFAVPWTKEQEAEARENLEKDEWFLSRPPRIQEAIRKRPPFFLYNMSSGSNCYLYSYSEPKDDADPVTVLVNVTLQWNTSLAFERQVFGVSLDDLTPIRLMHPW